MKSYYTCPKNLGYLIFVSDEKDAITSAFFSNKKEGKEIAGSLHTSLEAYFKKGTSLVFSEKIAQGTLFEQKVWREISKIPFGKTLTYSELAKKCGNEKAYRAAASACGKNPLALLVPCHRVVRSDGSATGYAWGIERKKWLLEFEQNKK